MSAESVATLVYGAVIGETPWEEEGTSIADWWTNTKFEDDPDECPVEEAFSGNALGWSNRMTTVLFARGHVHWNCFEGCVEDVDPTEMIKVSDKRDIITQFCRNHNIKIYSVGWVLLSSYG